MGSCIFFWREDGFNDVTEFSRILREVRQLCCVLVFEDIKFHGGPPFWDIYASLVIVTEFLPSFN